MRHHPRLRTSPIMPHRVPLRCECLTKSFASSFIVAVGDVDRAGGGGDTRLSGCRAAVGHSMPRRASMHGYSCNRRNAPQTSHYTANYVHSNFPPLRDITTPHLENPASCADKGNEIQLGVMEVSLRIVPRLYQCKVAESNNKCSWQNGGDRETFVPITVEHRKGVDRQTNRQTEKGGQERHTVGMSNTTSPMAFRRLRIVTRFFAWSTLLINTQKRCSLTKQKRSRFRRRGWRMTQNSPGKLFEKIQYNNRTSPDDKVCTEAIQFT